jgi:hypothetical protein
MTANSLQQKIIIGVVIALLVGGIIFLSIIPNINKINVLVGSISKSNSGIAMITASRNQSEDLKKKASEYENEFSLDNIYNMFVKKDAYKDFFNSIYELADKSSLECKVKYSGDSTKNTIEKNVDQYAKVDVETIGDFNNSILFLEKLENYPYLLDIIEYKISKQTDGKILSNFSLKVYASP